MTPRQAGPAWLHSDNFWGMAFLVLGIVALAWHPFERMDKAISNQTNMALTSALVVMGLVALLIATRASPAIKALTVAWVVLP